MKISYRVFPLNLGALTKAERVRIDAWHHAAFSGLVNLQGYDWDLQSHVDITVEVDGIFSGFLGVVRREVLLDGRKKSIAGIRGLVIDPNYRKKALGKGIMTIAHEVIFRLCNADYGFLLCQKEMEAFYSNLGWHRFGGEVLVENQGEKILWGESAMILCPGRSLDLYSPQKIDLMGRPF